MVILLIEYYLCLIYFRPLLKAPVNVLLIGLFVGLLIIPLMFVFLMGLFVCLFMGYFVGLFMCYLHNIFK